MPYYNLDSHHKSFAERAEWESDQEAAPRDPVALPPPTCGICSISPWSLATLLPSPSLRRLVSNYAVLLFRLLLSAASATCLLGLPRLTLLSAVTPPLASCKSVTLDEHHLLL